MTTNEEHLRMRIEENTKKLQEMEKETRRLINDNEACKHSLFKITKASHSEKETECLCCKGTCDCEYTCDHPHTLNEEEEEPEIPIDFNKVKKEIAEGKQNKLL